MPEEELELDAAMRRVKASGRWARNSAGDYLDKFAKNMRSTCLEYNFLARMPRFKDEVIPYPPTEVYPVPKKPLALTCVSECGASPGVQLGCIAKQKAPQVILNQLGPTSGPVRIRAQYAVDCLLPHTTRDSKLRTFNDIR